MIFKFSQTIGLFLLLAIASCAPEQSSYTHSIVSTQGLSDATITHIQDEKVLFLQPLAEGDITYENSTNADTKVIVADAGGKTTFLDVPGKYIQLDANVEVTRNVFHDYFPEKWAPMKGQNYTTIYIKSKEDDEVFYMKSVFTHTDKQIGRYSEDF